MPHRAKRLLPDVHPKAGRRGSGGAALERNIYGYLAATIGREIVRGVYPPGSLLPNVQDLCRRFSVSRTALREAYGLLTAKALIVARPKVGTWVRPRAEWHMIDPDVLAWHLESDPSAQFIADLFALRQMVEPGAAAAAARLHDPRTIEAITAAFGDMERYRDGSGDLIEADLQFHMAILSGSANPFLSALGGLIHASLQCVFRYSWKGAAKMADSRLRQHGVILEAIRAGDPGAAERRMAELLAASFEDVRAAFGTGEAAKPTLALQPKRSIATRSA
jgi:GntR family transcriptional regulator, galactonate operon transcriptional repressor